MTLAVVQNDETPTVPHHLLEIVFNEDDSDAFCIDRGDGLDLLCGFQFG